MHLVKSGKALSPDGKIKQQEFRLPQPLKLVGGGILKDVRVAYNTFGTLSADGSNVVWIFHALTANSNPLEWWPGLVGKGHFFDPDKYFIVCVNMLGSCYGTTGAADENPETGQKYGLDFPLVTIEDMVDIHEYIREHLGIEKIHCGIGGSMGGQQLLEWAVRKPDLFENIIPIATNTRHSAWGIAFNTAQRLALEADPTLTEYSRDAGKSGLEAARSIAMLSYRNQHTYNATQTNDDIRTTGFSADSYQRYQGKKLSDRFDAHSYYTLSKAMDSHHIGRNFESTEVALQQINARVLAVAIKSDLLFPPEEQEFITKNCKDAEFAAIESLYGHDGFLIESEMLTEIITDFLKG